MTPRSPGTKTAADTKAKCIFTEGPGPLSWGERELSSRCESDPAKPETQSKTTQAMGCPHWWTMPVSRLPSCST